MAQGGKFEQCFMAGGFSSLSGSLTTGIDNFVAEVVTGAVVGGTAAEIGGGKFANVAVTGAFTVMYNDLMHNLQAKPNPGHLTNKQASDLKEKIEDASFRERVKNSNEKNNTNNGVPDKVDASIGIERGNAAYGGTNYYEVKDMEINIGTTTVHANVAYVVQSNMVISDIEFYTGYDVANRVLLQSYDQDRGFIIQLQFNDKRDYNSYWNFVLGNLNYHK